MLKFTAELWPYGHERTKLLLGEVLISNTGECGGFEVDERGTYRVTAWENLRPGVGRVPPFYPGEKHERKEWGPHRVENFHRLEDGSLFLLYKGLQKVFGQ